MRYDLYRLPSRHRSEIATFYTLMRISKGPVLIPDRADDLIPEESETVLLALKRLPQKEAYDRVFRLRRAFQVSVVICSSWD